MQHTNQQHGLALGSFRARGLRKEEYFKGHLSVGVTYVSVAVLRPAQIYYSCVIYS